MDDRSIIVEGLGKRYLIGGGRKNDTLRDALTGFASRPLSLGRRLLKGKKDGSSAGSRHAFWALKDVSFEVRRGEAVGVIGRNGAGKSTLLKILSRITEPTVGRGEIRGRIGSLLEVGTGFHPELTGRENIYLNAAILGMKKSEINRKFDDIVNFAEVDEFIDTPVKHYSSGMYVRLAFAVAAHLEPEILIVDEVLAVGDAVFQKKCLGKMGDVTSEGRTVLFVSHNMGAVRSLCQRALLIEGGRMVMDGEPTDIIGAYLSTGGAGNETGEVSWDEGSEGEGSPELDLASVRLFGPDGTTGSVFDVNQPIRVEIRYRVKRRLRGIRIWISLITAQGEVAFKTTDHDSRDEEVPPGTYASTCTIPGRLLNIGRYTVRVGGGIPGVKRLFPPRDCLSFHSAGAGNQGSSFPEVWQGAVCPHLEWTVRKLD